jgi:UDP-galactopyranose mutase
VRANTKNGLISIPFSKKTAGELGEDLSPKEIQDLLFKEYSERHWGVKWEDLPKSITGRVPNKRDDFDDRYFTDKYQGIPEKGYTEMFHSMLDGIKVNLGVERGAWRKLKCDKLIWTGKISEYFNLEFGKLPYRSLRFQHFYTKKSDDFSWEKGAVINECNKQPFNRTMDSSVYLNEQVDETVLTRDFPEEHNEYNEAIYPKNFGSAKHIYSKYKIAAEADKNTIFLGRLATYKYLDMWMAVKQVMTKLR